MVSFMVIDREILPLFININHKALLTIDKAALTYTDVGYSKNAETLIIHFEPLQPLSVEDMKQCCKLLENWLEAFKYTANIDSCERILISGRIPLIMLLQLVWTIRKAYIEGLRDIDRELPHVYVFDPKLGEAVNSEGKTVTIPDELKAKLLGGYLEEAKKIGIV